jgi:hypothetical protein
VDALAVGIAAAKVLPQPFTRQFARPRQDQDADGRTDQNPTLHKPKGVASAGSERSKIVPAAPGQDEFSGADVARMTIESVEVPGAFVQRPIVLKANARTGASMGVADANLDPGPGVGKVLLFKQTASFEPAQRTSDDQA